MNASRPRGALPRALALAAAVLAAPAGAAEDPLAWLAGQWCGGEGGQRIEEWWLPARDGGSLGLSRTSAGGRLIAFEFMRIARIDGKVSLFAQPGGQPPTQFDRSGSGAGWIRFENPTHDYPQRIEYRRTGDQLVAEIGGPGSDGKDAVVTYRYAPCPAPSGG
jgi:hypothetical protein